jgi:hypothetical protein
MTSGFATAHKTTPTISLTLFDYMIIYELTVKPTGDTYLLMNIDFIPTFVSISMPGYVDKMLKRFRPHYLLPSHRPTQTPGPYSIPVYSKVQHAIIDNSPPLSTDQRKELQAIVIRHLTLLRPCCRPYPTNYRQRASVSASLPYSTRPKSYKSRPILRSSSQLK